MSCLFCKIVEGSIPSRIAYEDEHVVAFHDIAPQAPVHILVIPKKHITALNDAKPEDLELLGRIQLAARHVAKEAGIAESGYRVVTNNGADAGQVVFHIHYHVLGGEKLATLSGKE
ncbi:MAG: histidine triad nucleotide-binding protein [Cohnella sp.]|nr:histidine triad nucleotide-binding protein [Cohnella sp.]